MMCHFGPLGHRTGRQDHSHWNRLVLELGFPGFSSQTAQWEAVLWTCKNLPSHCGQFRPGTGPWDHHHWNRLVLELGFPGLSSQTAQWEAVSWTCKNLPSHFGHEMDGFEALAGQLCPRDGWFRGSVRAALSTIWMVSRLS